jgi:hypothetical protein
MPMVTRKYKVKDVDMVLAVSTIVENAKLHQPFLQTKRSTFTMEYFNQLQTEIDAVAQQFLGADNAKQLRDSTALLYAAQNEALKLASEMKLQIELDFPNEKSEMLTNFGYREFWKEAQKRDQEALINLLFRIKTNLNPALKLQMIANGTIEQDINALLAKADEMHANDTSQETSKANRPIKTEAELTAYNTLYTKVSSLAKLATKFYKGNATYQKLFSFSKISKTINMSPKKANATPVV